MALVVVNEAFEPAFVTFPSLAREHGSDGLRADLRLQKNASGKVWMANRWPRGLVDEPPYAPATHWGAVRP